MWKYGPTPPYITLAQCIIQKRNDLTSYLIQGKVSGSDAVPVVQAVLQNEFCFCSKRISGLLWYGCCSDTFRIMYKNFYTVIPRLTKIIRSGITFVSRSSLCYQASHFSLSRT